ncbi:hypothetical protein DRW41_13425 [Neobacillus piezotolerans]|uniref:Uncharacterized protein n=1 Tax=Neobacillus piezotolerans TaxID=2259171 RepID=A0A3D8GPW4_9BACI|nr:hypothetical protein [Neobacillus piezotolerans]RDU36524.1 hypothetical protein DRW41_13425 [Neobacillus piezotolerans]
MIINTRSSDERKVTMVAITIIMYISSFFVPFVIIASIHSMYFFKREYWFFETPPSSYIAFMIGMLLSAVLFTLYLAAAWKWESRKLGIALLAMQIITIPVYIGSVDNYYYATGEGIFFNKLAGYGLKKYAWEDMERVKVVYRHSNGSVRLDQYKFTTKDGVVVSIPYTSRFAESQWKIDGVIKANKLTVSDNYDNPIMD